MCYLSERLRYIEKCRNRKELQNILKKKTKPNPNIKKLPQINELCVYFVLTEMDEKINIFKLISY